MACFPGRREAVLLLDDASGFATGFYRFTIEAPFCVSTLIRCGGSEQVGVTFSRGLVKEVLGTGSPEATGAFPVSEPYIDSIIIVTS